MYMRILLAAAISLAASAASADTFLANSTAPGVQHATATLSVGGADGIGKWAMMLVGVGLLGFALRDRQRLALGEI